MCSPLSLLLVPITRMVLVYSSIFSFCPASASRDMRRFFRSSSLAHLININRFSAKLRVMALTLECCDYETVMMFHSSCAFLTKLACSSIVGIPQYAVHTSGEHSIFLLLGSPSAHQWSHA